MPNFMYPRTISITRSVRSKTTSDGYAQTETPVMSGIDASIQLKRNRSERAAAYPAATNSDDAMPTWSIYFKAAVGTVLKGDKITDETGITYIVEAPYWNSLGYALEARIYAP